MLAIDYRYIETFVEGFGSPSDPGNLAGCPFSLHSTRASAYDRGKR
jgi:hypothetical protein